VTRGFMGPLGGFWPKLGRKRVTGWSPSGTRENKQTNKQSLELRIEAGIPELLLKAQI
jgi:hypothetical protein